MTQALTEKFRNLSQLLIRNIVQFNHEQINRKEQTMTIEALKKLSNAVSKVVYQGAYVPKAENVVYRQDKESGRYVTVVHFDDGVKAVVKQCENDPFDLEKAVLWALVKRAYGKVTAKEARGKVQLELKGNGYATMIRELVEKAVDQGKKQEADAVKKAAAKKADAATEVKGDKPAATATRCCKGCTAVCKRGKRPLKSSPIAKLRKSVKNMTPAEKRQYWRWADGRRRNRKARQMAKLNDKLSAR